MFKKLYIEQGAVLERIYRVVAKIGGDFLNLNSQSYIEFISIVGRNLKTYRNVGLQSISIYSRIYEIV